MSQFTSAGTSGAGGPTYLNKGAIAFIEKFDFERTIQHILYYLSRLELRLTSIEKSFDHFRIAAQMLPAEETKPADEEVDPLDFDFDFDFDSNSEGESPAEATKEPLGVYSVSSKIPAPVGRSSVIFDVKPWNYETDMKAMEAAIRIIMVDGLWWGGAKILPVAYGIYKVQISCVIEDVKVSIDWLKERIEAIEHVQSVDLAAHFKI